MFEKFMGRIKNRISKTKTKNRIPATNKAAYSRTDEHAFFDALTDNPYLQSRALWNDLYGNLETKLENSYRIILILAVVIVLAIIGFVIVAGETKVKPIPFIVHGDEVLTVANTDSADFNRLKNTLAEFFIKQFIRQARSVSADGIVNANQRIAAYSMVTDAATTVLKDYYQVHNPNVIAQTDVITTTITSVLQESPQSFTIRWLEQTRNVRSGELTAQAHYIGQIRYHYGKPSENSTILKHNPLGLEITNLSWSLDDNNSR